MLCYLITCYSNWRFRHEFRRCTLKWERYSLPNLVLPIKKFCVNVVLEKNVWRHLNTIQSSNVFLTSSKVISSLYLDANGEKSHQWNDSKVEGIRARGRSPMRRINRVKTTLNGPLHEFTRSTRGMATDCEACHYSWYGDYDHSAKSVTTKKKNKKVPQQVPISDSSIRVSVTATQLSVSLCRPVSSQQVTVNHLLFIQSIRHNV